MIALTVRQPWAEQIAAGAKRAEYRSWRPRALRPGDRLLIVASAHRMRGHPGPYGVAVCTVRYGGVMELDPCEPSAEWGRWAWQLADPVRVAPVPIRGRLHTYEVPESMIRALGAE